MSSQEDYHILRHIVIDSGSRQNLSDNTNDFGIIVDVPALNWTHVSCTQLSIPKSFYTIKSGHNSFVVNEDGVNATVSITAGYYDSASLITAVENAMNLACAYQPYTMTYSGLTNKYTWVAGNVLGAQPYFTFPDASQYNGFWSALGFKSNESPVFVANTLTSTTSVNLPFVRGITVVSDIVEGSQDSSLITVLTAQQGPDYGYIDYQCNDHVSVQRAFTKSQYNIYRFSLYDQSGTNLVELNNTDWTMVLTLFAEPNKNLNNPQSVIYQ